MLLLSLVLCTALSHLILKPRPNLWQPRVLCSGRQLFRPWWWSSRLSCRWSGRGSRRWRTSASRPERPQSCAPRRTWTRDEGEKWDKEQKSSAFDGFFLTNRRGILSCRTPCHQGNDLKIQKRFRSPGRWLPKREEIYLKSRSLRRRENENQRLLTA